MKQSLKLVVHSHTCNLTYQPRQVSTTTQHLFDIDSPYNYIYLVHQVLMQGVNVQALLPKQTPKEQGKQTYVSILQGYHPWENVVVEGSKL